MTRRWAHGRWRALIQEHIKTPLADEVLFGKLKDGGAVRVVVDKDRTARRRSASSFPEGPITPKPEKDVAEAKKAREKRAAAAAAARPRRRRKVGQVAGGGPSGPGGAGPRAATPWAATPWAASRRLQGPRCAPYRRCRWYGADQLRLVFMRAKFATRIVGSVRPIDGLMLEGAGFVVRASGGSAAAAVSGSKRSSPGSWSRRWRLRVVGLASGARQIKATPLLSIMSGKDRPAPDRDRRDPGPEGFRLESPRIASAPRHWFWRGALPRCPSPPGRSLALVGVGSLARDVGHPVSAAMLSTLLIWAGPRAGDLLWRHRGGLGAARHRGRDLVLVDPLPADDDGHPAADRRKPTARRPAGCRSSRRTTWP